MSRVRQRAWQRWQAAAGSWRGWSVCPALCSPDADDIAPRPLPCAVVERLGLETAAALRGPGTLLVIDLDPLEGIHVAASLNRLRLAHVVIVLPRWPYAEAVLPVDGLIHALVTESRRLVRDEALPNVAFVLDAERNRSIPHRSVTDRRADNRYCLGQADLPDLAALRARGIRRVLRLVST
jgi:hypothetical protein